jgi:hypothetical protein
MYNKFAQDRNNNQYKFFISYFNHLQREFQIISKLVNEKKRRKADEFNVFSVLRLERKEVGTHSAFLGELLDPLGSHCQGVIFLSGFIELCQKKGVTFDRQIDKIVDERWFITREKNTRFGNLDIVLSAPALGYLIVIENKIDAGEQDKQLERYNDWLQSKKRFYSEKRVLCYLTPNASLSNTARSESDYITLSYHNDIYKWLSETVGDIPSIRVRETVNQYIELIKNI